MARIEADGVTIAFPFYEIGARSLKKRLLGNARLHADASNRVVVSALRDLTFRIGRGERVGLVGPNGAGKTTLLRTLAGIYEPAAGRLLVEGSVAALIDLSAGLNEDATGRENIELRGLHDNLSPDERRALAAHVEAFSGLGEFLDVPIRTYSAGMGVRLSFALATARLPQVLLMDEWFFAGDAAFKAGADARLAEMIGGADILVIATHDMAMVRRWCTRVIRVEDGRIAADGPVEAVLGMV